MRPTMILCGCPSRFLRVPLRLSLRRASRFRMAQGGTPFCPSRKGAGVSCSLTGPLGLVGRWFLPRNGADVKVRCGLDVSGVLKWTAQQMPAARGTTAMEAIRVFIEPVDQRPMDHSVWECARQASA